MKRHSILWIALLAISYIGMAQKPAGPAPVTDKRLLELLRLLKTSDNNMDRARLLLGLAEFYRRNTLHKDSAILYAEKARSLSRSLRYDSVYNEANYSICRVYIGQQKMEAARNILPLVGQEQQARLLTAIGEGFLFRPGQSKKDLDSAFSYFNQALNISKSIASDRQRHETLISLGKYYFASNKFDSAKNCFLVIISDLRQTGDRSAEAHIWSELGKFMPDSDSTYQEELFVHGKAMEMYFALGDTNNARSSLEDIGAVNTYHSNFAIAKTQFLRAIELRNAVGSKNVYKDYMYLALIAHAMGDLDEALSYSVLMEKSSGELSIPMNDIANLLLGLIYADDGQTEKSLHHLLQPLQSIDNALIYLVGRKIVEQYILLGKPEQALSFIRDFEQQYPAGTPGDEESLSASKGDCYAALNKPMLAEKYYKQMIRKDDEAYKYRNRQVLAFPITIAGTEAYYKIANFYAGQHKHDLAGSYLAKALQAKSVSANQFYTSNLMRKIWWLKFKIDSSAGNHLAAIQSYEKFTALNDSIFNASKSRQMQHLQVQYETEKKESAIAAKDQQIRALTQNDLLRQSNLRQAKLIRNIMLVGIIGLLITGALFYRQYLQKQRANKLVVRKNIQMEHLLTEKEWLLKEVNHRVKNNLHTIICLLESQASYLESDALAAIENSQHRVYAMSLIHQKLYQAEKVKTIGLGSYLPEFIQYLKDSFDTSQSIVFELDIDPIQLDVSRAVPVALILNEAVTNSIKYAFPDKRKGLIRVILHETGDEIMLMIADNGIGMKNNIAEGALNSLGVELMRGLTKDLKGHIKFENDQGTKITIVFPHAPVSAVDREVYFYED